MSKDLNKKNIRLIRKEDSKKCKGKNPIYKSKKEMKRMEIKKISFILNGVIAEMIYSRKNKRGAFIIYNSQTNDIKVYNKFEYSGKIYIPDINSKLIQKNVVMIPGGIEEYGSTQDLISNLHRFLNKYVYIEDAIDREIVVTYILLTWVYERFTSIPYLRVLGDYGTGKSRLLKVLNICNKSIYTSGNASAAPIFRLIDKYKGTLIIDEAEFGRNTERNEDIKEILRFGKDSDGVVTRCDPNTNDPIPYEVFGPKILGSRRSYSDDALESRIISIKMTEAKGNDIPIMLEKEKFKKICEAFRLRLLLWRFYNYFEIDVNAYKKYVSSNVSKRLNEMYAPLICIRADDEKFISSLIAKAEEKHKNLLEDKSMSLEANIVKGIVEIKLSNKGRVLLKDITENINLKYYKKYQSRFIGSIVRDSLDLETEHTRDGSAVVWNKHKIKKLLKEYNLLSILEPYREMRKKMGRLSSKGRKVTRLLHM